MAKQGYTELWIMDHILADSRIILPCIVHLILHLQPPILLNNIADSIITDFVYS